MKKKEIKLIIFILFLFLIFSIFLFLTFKSYNYEKEYKINEFSISEKFNKEDNYYTFNIKDNNQVFSYIIKNQYNRKRELINEIKVQRNDSEICILPISDKLSFYPLCSNKEEIYTYNLASKEESFYNYKKIKPVDEKYENININYLNNAYFLLYNYKGFYLINGKNYKDIKLFNKDVYSINLIYQKDNYLIIADYNQDYYFNKFYKINIKNGKVKEIEFEYDISYDSIFLGDYKNNIYILDKKEEKEYILNINKDKFKEIDFQILKDNKLEKTTFKSIIKNNLRFPRKYIYHYEIINETLYLFINDNKIKISDKKVDKIISNKDDTIYYLCNENLYMYNNIYGEVLILSNFEWNFNNTNMIYLYE